MIQETQTARTADYQSLVFSERLTQTYSKLILHRPILNRLREDLGLKAIGRIQVTPERNTQLMKITVEDKDPATAADIANTLVRIFSEEMVLRNTKRFSADKTGLQEQITEMESMIAQISEQIRTNRDGSEKSNIETRRTQYRQIYSSLLHSLEQIRMAEARASSNIVHVEPAYPPTRPIKPRVLRMTALAMILGLMFVVGVVFGYDALDTTIKDPEDLSRQTSLPILAVIARHTSIPGTVISDREPRSPVTEAFRSLRTNISFASVDRPLRLIMVTSPTPTEGKTTISTNLAVVLAHSGKRVILVDADMRRPMVQKTMGLPKAEGLSRLFIESGADAEAAAIESGVPGLRVLQAGSLPPNPSELLGSNRMKGILDSLLETSDVVVLDTPPLMTVTDAAVLAGHTDGVVLVFRPGGTKTVTMKQAVEQMRRAGAPVLGLVANDVNLSRGRYGHYYYQEYYSKYSYYAEDGGKKRRNRF